MSRRAKGEGSVDRLGDLWRGRVVTTDGKRRAVYAKTKAEVVRKMRDLRTADSAGVDLSRTHTTVGDFIAEEYLPGIRRVCEPKTYQTYESCCRLWITPHLGRRRLRDVAPRHLEALLTDISAGSKLSPRSQAHVYTRVHAILEMAVRKGYTDRNVAAVVDAPRVVQRLPEMVIDEASALRIIEAAGREPLGAMVIVALATGSRWQHVAGLLWADIDFARQCIHFRQALKEIGPGARGDAPRRQLAPPKTQRSVRDVPMIQPVADVLQVHRARQAELRLAQGSAWGGSRWAGIDLVFTTSVGTPILRSNFGRGPWRRIREATGLSPRFHDLRHGAASLLMVLTNGDRRLVADILGVSVGVLDRVYAHTDSLSPRHREALDRLGALFG